MVVRIQQFDLYRFAPYRHFAYHACTLLWSIASVVGSSIVFGASVLFLFALVKRKKLNPQRGPPKHGNRRFVGVAFSGTAKVELLSDAETSDTGQMLSEMRIAKRYKGNLILGGFDGVCLQETKMIAR